MAAHSLMCGFLSNEQKCQLAGEKVIKFNRLRITNSCANQDSEASQDFNRIRLLVNSIHGVSFSSFSIID